MRNVVIHHNSDGMLSDCDRTILHFAVQAEPISIHPSQRKSHPFIILILSLTLPVIVQQSSVDMKAVRRFS
jgi:hypothetical protein